MTCVSGASGLLNFCPPWGRGGSTFGGVVVPLFSVHLISCTSSESQSTGDWSRCHLVASIWSFRQPSNKRLCDGLFWINFPRSNLVFSNSRPPLTCPLPRLADLLSPPHLPSVRPGLFDHPWVLGINSVSRIGHQSPVCFLNRIRVHSTELLCPSANLDF